MKCFQCNKEASEIGEINGYALMECADGHRTGQMTKAQEKESLEKTQVDLDSDGNVTLKAKKSRKQSLKKAA